MTVRRPQSDPPRPPQASRGSGSWAAAPPRRPSSHLRFNVQSTPTGEISTLPPPPFERETDVSGLEWWLEAHMSLAGGILCVEQLAQLAPAGGPDREVDAEFIAVAAASLERVRDALYELYCDAADARVRKLVVGDSAIANTLRGIYRVIDETVAALLEQGARELATARAALLALPEVRSEAWLDGFTIDEENPLEPLRRLRRDLAALRSALDLLGRVLKLER